MSCRRCHQRIAWLGRVWTALSGPWGSFCPCGGGGEHLPRQTDVGD